MYKAYLMKKLFNLKMAEGVPIVEHLNKLNTIISQLVSVEIKFDDDLYALILLASLSNSWEPLRATIRYSIGNAKLKLSDTILVEKVCKIDFREVLMLSSILNPDNRERGFKKNSNKKHSRK